VNKWGTTDHFVVHFWWPTSGCGRLSGESLLENTNAILSLRIGVDKQLVVDKDRWKKHYTLQYVWSFSN